MQIVIDIPDNLYNTIKNDEYGVHQGRIYDIIRGGTPLPKRHGDLKDVNQLLKMTDSYKSELGRFKVDPFVKCGIETVESFIEELPTIIEEEYEEAENE